MLGLPLAGSYHTELSTYAALRSGDDALGAAVEAGLSEFYGACDVVLSPSAASDARLAELGVENVGRWDRGVDVHRFSPELRDRAVDGRIRVLYAGRLTKEKGADLLADAFLAARARDPRLELYLAGGGPEEDALRARLGSAAHFLGWLEGDGLARAYADADLFLFCSQTDTFGQVLLEAQASGLPVVAVDAGGPAGADRLRPHRHPLPGPHLRDRRRRGRPRRLPRGPRPPLPRRPRLRPRTHLGSLARRPRHRLAPSPRRPRTHPRPHRGVTRPNLKGPDPFIFAPPLERP